MSREVRITVLSENTASNASLICEHGLSLYIETPRHKILFDTGQSDAFAKNAADLGIDLSLVDVAILSHGHYDHGGGMKKFLEINEKAPIYLTSKAFGKHFNAKGEYIGLDLSLRESDRLVFTDDRFEIDKELKLFSCNGIEKISPVETSGLEIEENGIRRADDFLHEQYLLICASGKRILVSGCSHKGIVNIAEWFSPDILVGGFHFSKINDREKISSYARKLLEYPTSYFTGHCTGEKQFEILKEIMGDRIEYIPTGYRKIL